MNINKMSFLNRGFTKGSSQVQASNRLKAVQHSAINIGLEMKQALQFLSYFCMMVWITHLKMACLVPFKLYSISYLLTAFCPIDSLEKLWTWWRFMGADPRVKVCSKICIIDIASYGGLSPFFFLLCAQTWINVLL